MLATLSLTNWINLGLAILLALGPGYLALVIINRNAARPFASGAFTLIAVLSITIWAILLSCFQVINFPATKILVILLLAGSWLTGIWIDHPWKNRVKYLFQAHEIVLWFVILSILVFFMALNQNMVAGLGSDSYHHTLIVQMILENHGLPDNYLPYAPIATFTYHYGYHAMTALLALVTGITPRLMVLLSGPFLMVLAALAVCFLTNRISKNPWAGVLAAALTGLAGVFPGYMLTWGRYTQLMGLCILAVFLGVLIDWAKDGFSRKASILLALLAAGVFLSHYRVAIMAAAAAIVFYSSFWIAKRKDPTMLRKSLNGSLVSLGIAILLSLPWLWHLLASRNIGQAVERAAASSSYFDLQRLGLEVLNFPTNTILLAGAALAILWAILRRRWETLWLPVWSGLLIFLALPRLGAEILDTITVVISLFLPIIALISWALINMLEVLRFKPIIKIIAVLLLTLPLCLSGMLAIKPFFSAERVYPGTQDLESFEWIRTHIPGDARFMVNTYNFDFLATYIIGSDGGYWLPLLTGRSSVVPPMNYSTERWEDPEFLSRLVSLHALDGHLASPEAVQALCARHVTHIYIGEHGGIIDTAALDESSYYSLLHREGNTAIYQLKDSVCASD
jgi:hypothetical protein